MPKAARTLDPVSHSYVAAGMLAGAAVGSIAGAVIGAAIVSDALAVGAVLLAAGPIGWFAAAVLVVGAVVVAGVIGHALVKAGTAVGGAIGSSMSAVTGAIGPPCSVNVFVNSRGSARSPADIANCTGPPGAGPHPAMPLAQGSGTVHINSLPAVRVGDKVSCGATVSDGSSNVIIGGPTVTMVDIQSEIPPWMDRALFWIEMIPGIFSAGRALWKMGAAIVKNPGIIAATAKSLKGAVCKLTGCPVDAISGATVEEGIDFALPSRVALEWKRIYVSNRDRVGSLGHRWECPADARLVLRPDGLVEFWSGAFTEIKFPSLPRTDGTVTEPIAGCRLTVLETHFEVGTREGRVYCFPRFSGTRKESPVEEIRDASGNALTFRRQEGTLREILDSSGPRLEIRVEGTFIKQIVLHHPGRPPKVLVTYGYSPAGDLTRVTDPLGNAQSYTYEHHLLSGITHRGGVTFQHEYDGVSPSSRCTRACGPAGLYRYGYTYEPSRRITRYSDSLGHSTEIVFDAENYITRETDALGHSTHYEYDGFGRTTSVTDPLGRRTAYAYDEFGNVLSISRPDGASIAHQYDARHCLTQITDAAGHVWKQEWDDRRRLTRRITPLGHTREYSYDERGDLIAFKNPRGAVTRFERDMYTDGIVGIVDPLGHHVSWQLDPLGRVTRHVDQVGAITDYELDAKGRITGITRPTGAEVRFAYDGEMNLTEYHDELGHITRFAYCGLNKLAARHLPDGSTVRYEYDTEERLTAVINGRGERYRLDRDPVGRIVRRIDYWDAATELRYNAAGELIHRLDPLTRLTSYDRDMLGRLRARVYGDGTDERFAYDPLGNLAEFANADARVTGEYDADGRLIREQQNDFAVEYAYDAAGNCIRRTSAAGNIIEYGYDAAEQFDTLKVNGVATLTNTYDPRGLPVRAKIGGSLQRTQDFDLDRRLTRQRITGAGGAIFERDYEYDSGGNLLRRTASGGRADAFLYDPVGRLTRHCDPEGAIRQFMRDAAGDFIRPEPAETGEAASAPRPTAEGEASDRPARRVTRFGGKQYRFDAAGNVIEIQTNHQRTRLYWSGENRLSSARTPAGPVARYQYDALGRRTAKSFQGQTRRFAWDGDAMMAECVDGKWREYVMEPGGFAPIALIEEGRVLHFGNNQVGAPEGLFTGDGKVVWAGEYGAWGDLAKNPVRQQDNPLRLQGQYLDEESTFHYNRCRYYDPQAGVFLSQDPLGLAAGDDLYAIAPNVQNWVDPLGLACAPIAGTTLSDVSKSIAKNKGLPGNFITKDEAKALGWNPKTGNLDAVAPGKSIGGDVFRNKEGLLPQSPGRTWYEADLNYAGGYRGGERLLYSNDGKIFYSGDHYKTFQQIGN